MKEKSITVMEWDTLYRLHERLAMAADSVLKGESIELLREPLEDSNKWEREHLNNLKIENNILLPK